ncbi:MAG: DUF429 domain-containing protein [Balneolaceae bacterium]
MKTLGIDGCRAGWIAISLDEQDAGYWIFESDGKLEEFIRKWDRIFIDIPIGLSDDQYVRTCDRELRKKLGPEYKATVFNPPIRPALHAPTYAEASMESYETTGNKVSIQAWNITPKIRAIDRFLQEEKGYRDKLLESHPELLFQQLNGGNPILQKKATKKGLRHRLSLISKHTPYADDFFREIKEEYRQNQVQENDIVDALVLALYAGWSRDRELKTLPDDPPVDSTGLKMAIHYL